MRVMVAVDGSRSADAALGFAISLCRKTHAHLEVLTVKPDPVKPRIGYSPKIPEVEAPEGAETIALTAAEKADRAGVQSHAHVDRGDPAEVIATTARALEVDLIVAGTRGRHPIVGVLLGSVSEGVLRQSRIPLTLVHPVDDPT
jgi:nucleotide-binding universal stress UspA family protein